LLIFLQESFVKPSDGQHTLEIVGVGEKEFIVRWIARSNGIFLVLAQVFINNKYSPTQKMEHRTIGTSKADSV